MRIWVGVTDEGWFEHLRAAAPVEVNFWQPSGKAPAKFFEPGTPFLFKLKYPRNFIVGGGFFLRFSQLPMELAWAAFGTNNGLSSRDEFYLRIRKYNPTGNAGSLVGCSILIDPFFWHEPDWIPAPASWAPNIVQGKSFDTGSNEGSVLWAEVQNRLQANAIASGVAEPTPKYGQEFLSRARLGQGSFRVMVTEAYARRCAVTGERTLLVLEAAHIRPYAGDGSHRTDNGLLLRSDWHTLFDRGYVTVTEDLRVLVSARIREEFSNGRDYYRHHGRALTSVPESAIERPSIDALRWHNENRYVGA